MTVESPKLIGTVQLQVFFSKSEGTYIFSFHVGADKIMLISDILSSWASLLVWMTLGLSFFHHWAEAWNCCYHSFQSNRISTSPESNVYFSEKSDLPYYSKRKFYTAYTSMNYKSRPFWQFHEQGHVVRWKGIIENWQARYVSFMLESGIAK